MKTNTLNKKEVVKLVKQMLAKKELVRSYLRGNISKETLRKKGITLANPL